MEFRRFTSCKFSRSFICKVSCTWFISDFKGGTAMALPGNPVSQPIALHVQQDWSVEQLPVTLGDDSDLAIDDGDGGLVVDGVARHVERGGPALRFG